MKRLPIFLLIPVALINDSLAQGNPETDKQLITIQEADHTSQMVIAAAHNDHGSIATTDLLMEKSTWLNEAQPDSTIAYNSTEPVVIDALFMYPNPTSGMVKVKLPGTVSLQVYTLSGQLISRHKLAQGEKFIDLSALPAGIYQVRAKSDEDYFSGKLLIQ